MSKKQLFLFFLPLVAVMLVFVGCNSAEPTVAPEFDVIDEDAVIDEPAVVETGSFLMVETLGNVHWDGTQITTQNLGLRAGYSFDFTLRFKIPSIPDGGIGILLQGNEPNWTTIASSNLITDDGWQTITGTLDLTDTQTVGFSHIQIVKNSTLANETANVVILIDELTVVNGDDLRVLNFHSGRIHPFLQRGHSLLSVVAEAEIANLNFTPPTWDLELPSLATIFSDYFYFGNILEPDLIRNNPGGVTEMFVHQYNAITAENAMKPDAVSGGGHQLTRPAALNLANAETMVAFAEEHDLFMIGHTLVWHEQSAPWLYFDSVTGEYLTRAEAMENMRWFIEHYAGHFEERVHAWDVANEVFTNNGTANSTSSNPEGSPTYPGGTWQRALRNYAPWYQAFANGADFEAGERGWDYIYYAFVFTRRYAPSALLIYNDFNEEIPSKRDAIANMVEELNDRWTNDAVNNPAFGDPNHPDYGRLLIEVIGMQAHYNESTNLGDVRAALTRFAGTGARIHVTELDLQFTSVVAPFALAEHQLTRQADMFAQLFAWYLEFSDYIDRVSIWGREDGSSWRGRNGATHFNRHFEPKPAFWAIIDPHSWLQNN